MRQVRVLPGGTLQISEILKDASRGEGKAEDLSLLVGLGEAIKMGALCSLGTNVPNPLLSSLRLFRDKFEMHIKKKGALRKRCGVETTDKEGVTGLRSGVPMEQVLRMIKLQIDGKDIETEEGKSVLDSSLDAGIYIRISLTIPTFPRSAHAGYASSS
jgi:hypothetical protein